MKAVPASRRPRVAVVVHDVEGPGGMERACAELIRRAAGFIDFVVISCSLSEELRPLVVWHRVPAPRGPIPLKFLMFYVYAAYQIKRSQSDLVQSVGAIVPNRIDLAWVHFCHAGFQDRTGYLIPPGGSMLRRANKLVATILARLAERWSYRPARCRMMAAVSSGVAAELAAHYPRVSLRVTPNGVDAESFMPDPGVRDAIRRRHGTSREDVVLLFVGGNWELKGLAVAIQGMAEAQRGLAVTLRLWVVGDGNPKRFIRLARGGGIVDRVHFFGSHRDIRPFYQSADILISPSLYESFSLVALEAAACGLPLVATAVGCIEDLVGSNEAGLIVKRTSGEVASAIAQLAVDARLRNQLGEVGRQRSLRYSWTSAVAGIIDAYRDLLAGSPTGDQMEVEPTAVGSR